MSFLFHAARTWVLICGSHMLQMLPFPLWSDHHDKGTACSINRSLDWFHILLWFSDRSPGATSRSMSDSIHLRAQTPPPAPGRWQSHSLNSAQRSFKDVCPSRDIEPEPITQPSKGMDLTSPQPTPIVRKTIWYFFSSPCGIQWLELWLGKSQVWEGLCSTLTGLYMHGWITYLKLLGP